MQTNTYCLFVLYSCSCTKLLSHWIHISGTSSTKRLDILGTIYCQTNWSCLLTLLSQVATRNIRETKLGWKRSLHYAVYTSVLSVVWPTKLHQSMRRPKIANQPRSTSFHKSDMTHQRQYGISWYQHHYLPYHALKDIRPIKWMPVISKYVPSSCKNNRTKRKRHSTIARGRWVWRRSTTIQHMESVWPLFGLFYYYAQTLEAHKRFSTCIHHDALKWILNTAETIGKLLFGRLLLSEFELDVTYRDSIKNQAAEAL